jgi:ABC-type taurine transport system ATPase subunit
VRPVVVLGSSKSGREKDAKFLVAGTRRPDEARTLVHDGRKMEETGKTSGRVYQRDDEEQTP